MKTKRLLFSGLATLLGAPFVGLWASCDSGQSAPEAPSGMRVVMAAAQTCQGEDLGNEDLQLPDGTSEVVIRIANADNTYVKRLSRDEALPGRVMVNAIAPGDYTVDVVTCDTSGQAQWAGTTPGVTVAASTKAFPDILITPIGKTACTESTGGTGGAYAGAAVDGKRVYMAGGISGVTSRVANSTTQIREFSMVDGTISVLSAALSEPRFGAHAEMVNGKIRLFGGGTAFWLGSAPQIIVTGAAPTCGVVDIDPASGEENCVSGTTAMPSWPSVAKMGSILVAVGGIETPGVPQGPSPGQPSNALFLLDGDTLTTNSMANPRYGATVVPLGDAATLVFGGNYTSGPAAMAELVLSTGDLVPLTFVGPPPPAIPYLATGAYLGQSGGRDVVVIAGGDEFTPPNSFGVRAASRVGLVFIDGTSSQIEYVPLDVGDDMILFERSAAQMVTLDDGDIVLLGGITRTQKYSDNPDDCEQQVGQCLRRAMVRFRVDVDAQTVTVVDRDVTLTLGSFGAQAIPLGDGAHLLASGIDDLQGPVVPPDGELLRFSGALDALCAAEATP